MNKTSHTEYLELLSVLIKPVTAAFRSDELINEQWQGLNYLEKPNFQLAIDEYKKFESLLTTQSREVLHLPESLELSMDSVYCRDASIATDFGMILCQMGKKDRELEPQAQKSFFI